MAVPLMSTMTSPCSSPALAAGEPAATLRTTAPCVGVKPYCWRSDGVSVVMSTPRYPPPLPEAPPFWSWGSSTSTWSIGMANPMFWEFVPSLAEPATAVFMPMTCPAVSMSGPPELPGLMAASVWIRFCRLSVAVPVPPACTVRPRAETMPWVTVGVPAARPSALPMATTASPTTAFCESPKVTVGRPDALSILSSAMSFVSS